MSKFSIILADPLKFKNEILSLWKNNLPGTPPARLEWMKCNPDGSAIWYLAIDEETEMVAGALSIMPRRVRLGGQAYLAGIVGDLMVEEQYRVFGPFLQLLKTAVKDHPGLGFSFLYTFPNRASEKVLLRAGFMQIGFTKRFAKLLNPKEKLKRHMHPGLANLLSPGLRLLLRMFSKETYIQNTIAVQEIAETKALEEIFQMSIDDQWGTIGERSLEYLKWRYLQNPLYNFNIYAFKHPGSHQILGQIIFSTQKNHIHIFDIVVNNSEAFESVLGVFLKRVRRTGYNNVSIRILEESPLSLRIEAFGFSDRKEDVPLLFAGDSRIKPTKWLFLDGDRNV